LYWVADAEERRRQRYGTGKPGVEEGKGQRRDRFAIDGNAGVLGDSGEQGLQKQRSVRGTSCGQVESVQGQAVERTGAPTNGFWSHAEWLPCRDGKARPVERSLEPLVDGLAGELGLVRLERRSEGEKQGEEVTIFAPLVARSKNRVGRLRGYGNCIVAPQAEAFIRAVMTATKEG
jgi:DNA (cytosine-5)-methyltransferase 1